MHPAFSVIFLTTLIGAGQGLFLALFTGQVYSLLDFIPAQDHQTFYGLGSFLALFLMAGGLIASFFHLGHPERAWRSMAMWRTSWLSREVIVLPIFMFFLALYGLIHYMQWTQPLFHLSASIPVDASLLVGFVATFVALVLFVCTGMIYACLKFLQEWHSPLTVLNFTLLGSASGFTLATVFAAYTAPDLLAFYLNWALILTVLAAVGRGASLLRNAKLRGRSTPQTAIGVRHTKVVQKSQGSMGGSFNTREFFHGKSELVVRNMRTLFLLLVFPLPIAFLLIGQANDSAVVLVAAFVLQYVGLIAERWFFFAEAKHPQNLYYQQIS
ncbi:MAG: DmsC/YnfH family molybdoenzyme membrane anchor subunit [Gammaproteobacteria bacterium]|nr:DmsC/YnfH family molybdoenzyme membrane anchor subunit [Gammaproteobacteria bacterium]